MPCCEIHPRVMTPEEQRRELEDPLAWLPAAELARRSQVAGFYAGACVLLTGATGFVGTLVLEKLLRACPGVSTIYVIVRDKRGVPLRERLRAHLDKLIYSKAREACPDYLRKVVAVAGDLTRPRLGLSDADAAELKRRVSVFFHVAATVRFDADLRTAAVTNVGSTCDAVKLAREMPNLKAFVYVSTAYSNSPQDVIDEKFYPPGLDADELLKLVSVTNDEQLAQLLPQILGDWPNTYTFTKAIAEDVVRVRGAGLPFSVIRPSIVTVTYREPLIMWMGNMYGPIALSTGASLGLVHVLPVDSQTCPDGVPADLVANATIACAWDTWRRHATQAQTQLPALEPVIYNCVSTRHPFSWENVHTYGKGYHIPNMKNFWYSYGVMHKQKFLYAISAVICHLVPAIVADTILRIQGKKPILWNLYSRIHGAIQALETFIARDFVFKDDNFVSLLGRMGEVDKKLFPADITEIDHEWHIGNTTRGMRVYILNESFDNLKAAERKYRWLTILHFSLVGLAVLLLVFVLWRVLAAYIGL